MDRTTAGHRVGPSRTRQLRTVALVLILPLVAALVVGVPGGSGALAASTYDLLVSRAPDRSAPSPLDGATVTGHIYVFTSPETSVKRVSFWVDDPTMTGAAYKVEGAPPFDLAGTASDRTALPFDTSTLVDGSHTVTARVEPKTGSAQVTTATFTVDNQVPALTFTPTSVTLSAVEGGTPAVTTASVDTNDASATAAALSTNASWLSTSPTSAGTPADITVTADPTGLPGGTYTAAVTASSAGYVDAVLGVTLTVVSSSSGHSLQLSRLPDRSSPTSLTGATVHGDVYVSTAPDTDVERVRFWVDDPSMSGAPYATEKAAPFDLAGTAADGSALPFDTTALADGAHTVSALLDLTDGSTAATESEFTVDNTSPRLVASPSSLSWRVREGGGPVEDSLGIATSDGSTTSFSVASNAAWLSVSPTTATTPSELALVVDPTGLASGTHTSSLTVSADGYLAAVVPVTLSVLTVSGTYDLRISTSADRSAPTSLDGAIVTGDIHVFTAPDTDVRKVRFWVDDPAMTGTPHMVEFDAPFDLNGTAADGTAVPYDTMTLSDGNHTITAVLDLADGSGHLAEATFAIDNLPPGLAFAPSTTSFALDVDGDSASQSVDLTVDDGGSADFTITSDAAWLTASPTTGTAPTQVTVTADPAGLTAGTYDATLTASSDGRTSATLSVTVTVGDTGGCEPIACSEILVDLPYLLTFDEDHAAILDADSGGTGFTYVDPPSKGDGYLRERIGRDTGALTIETTAGLASGSSNSQDNALAVGIDAPSQVTVLATTLLDVPTGTGNYEQGGLWFGNDEDDHVKLTAQSAPTGPRIEFLMEVAGSTKKAFTKDVIGLEGSDVTLKLKAVPDDRTITASFSVNGGPFDTLGSVTAPGEFFSFDAAGIDPTIGTRTFGGIFASHRHGPAPVIYRFDALSVTAALDEVVQTSTEFDRVSFPVPYPTSMVWGPDDRLYVTELFGTIHALTLDEHQQVVDDQEIGTLGPRLTLGIDVDPASTADDVTLWVAHSNPSLDNGEVNSSTVTRLSGADFSTREDVITGLPRALANHAINSIHFGPDGRLYIAQGGNTGAGAPNTANTEFGDRPEQPLSAALLVADVKAAGFEGDCATPLGEFGVPQTCDVAVFASGLRNTYDFVLHSNGGIYGPDNGLGVTGTYPPTTDPPCTGLADADLHNPGPQSDGLNLIEPGRYYGHPNPYRDECVFKDGRWQGVAAPANYTPPIYDLGNNRSANGMIEYRGDAFCGGLRNELLIANYSVGDNITRLRLADDGRSVVAASSLVGDLKDPLPIVEGPGGVIYVGEFGGGKVTALVPRDPGCWQDRTPLPTKLLDAGGAALDGRLYVVGGKTGSGYQSTTYVYEPSTDSWTVVGDLPGAAVENPAVVAYDGRLYAFGGATEPFAGAVTNAAVLDPVTGTWTPLAPMPTARGGAAAQVIGTRIHVAGGMGADGASLAVVEVYDPATDTWTTTTPMTTPRDNPGSAVLGGQLYLFGGRTRNADGTTVNGTLNTVESLDPSTGTWTARAPMPTGRRTMMVGTLDGRAQVMGGEIRDDGGAFDANEEYDPATDTWRLLTPLPTARHGGVAGTISGVVHVVAGGPTGGSAHTDVHETFSFATTAPRLAADPGSLRFDAVVGDPAMSSTVHVWATDDAGTSVTATTTGEPWLSASPGVLTTPGQLEVTVDPAGLDAGTYSASISFSAAGYPDLTVPVTLTVAAPSLVATPSSVSLSVPEGGDAASAVVDVTTNDGGTPTVGVTSDRSWLSATPTEVTTPASITVTADPTGLPAGRHSGTITASTTAYPDLAIPVTLTVEGEIAYDILVSASSDRSSPTSLGGSTASGDIHVFTSPDDEVDSVDFWVDDPTMSGTPAKSEARAPFDLAGTDTSTGLANPYDTTQLADGTHTVTAALRHADGTTTVTDATFVVDNTAGGSLTFGRTSTSLAALAGGSSVSETLALTADDLSAQAVQVTADVPWLSVDPGSATTPADVTLTADPTTLAEGVHVATVTATADDPSYADASLAVEFHVRSSLVPDQVHLAWVESPATTLTVVWRTWDDDTPSTVEFRPAGASEWAVATGGHRPAGTTGVLHEATLTGLTPATPYEYRVVGDHGSTSEVATARTGPAAGGAFDVVFVADTGIDGRTDGLTTGTAQVRDEIAALAPDLVLAGGDFASHDTDDRFSTLDDAIDAWFQQMQPVGTIAPLMPAYGDHEIVSEGFDPWAARFPTPDGHDGRRNYSFRVGDVHFVSILHVHDTGGLPQSQLDWIAGDIAAAQADGARWIVPFLHGSLYTDGTNHPPNADVRAQLAPLFETADVPLVLSSHDQAFERSYPLVEMTTADTPTSSSLTCYQLGTDGTVWVKASPGGKLSSGNAAFSAFASDPPPPWSAVRDNTVHNFAHLAFGTDGAVVVTTYGVVGDGTAPTILDRFTYGVDPCG